MKRSYCIDRVNRPKNILSKFTLRTIEKSKYKIVTLLNNIITEDSALDCYIYQASL